MEGHFARESVVKPAFVARALNTSQNDSFSFQPAVEDLRRGVTRSGLCQSATSRRHSAVYRRVRLSLKKNLRETHEPCLFSGHLKPSPAALGITRPLQHTVMTIARGRAVLPPETPVSTRSVTRGRNRPNSALPGGAPQTTVRSTSFRRLLNDRALRIDANCLSVDAPRPSR